MVSFVHRQTVMYVVQNHLSQTCYLNSCSRFLLQHISTFLLQHTYREKNKQEAMDCIKNFGGYNCDDEQILRTIFNISHSYHMYGHKPEDCFGTRHYLFLYPQNYESGVSLVVHLSVCNSFLSMLCLSNYMTKFVQTSETLYIAKMCML